MDTKELTTERGSDYGKPIDHFNTIRQMFDIWEARREGGRDIPEELDNVLKHIAYLVIDKLVRSAENPMKQDNYDDIQGYASLWEDTVEEFYDRKHDENITD